MTDDELKRYLEAVEYDIGASLPGAETTYALGQEVLSLRAALRTLRQQSDEYDAVLLFITSMPDDSPQSLARCRRQAHAAAGLDGDYGGHSGRSGFVTSAFEAGVNEADIMSVTDHKSVTMLRKYRRKTGAEQAKAVLAVMGG